MKFCKSVDEFEIELLSTMDDYELIKDLNPKEMISLARAQVLHDLNPNSLLNNRVRLVNLPVRLIENSEFKHLSNWLLESLIKTFKPGVRMGKDVKRRYVIDYYPRVDEMAAKIIERLDEAGYIRRITYGPNTEILFSIVWNAFWLFFHISNNREALYSKAERLKILRFSSSRIDDRNCGKHLDYICQFVNCCGALFGFYVKNFLQLEYKAYESFDYESFERSSKTILERIIPPQHREFIEWMCLHRRLPVVVTTEESAYYDAIVFSLLLSSSEIVDDILHIDRKDVRFAVEYEDLFLGFSELI